MTIAEMKKRIDELETEKSKLEEEIASLENAKFNNDSFSYEMDKIPDEELVRSEIRIKAVQDQGRRITWRSIKCISEEDELRSISQSIEFLKKLSRDAKDMIKKLSRRIDMYKESEELPEDDFSSTE